jgi:hypothetical protein
MGLSSGKHLAPEHGSFKVNYRIKDNKNPKNNKKIQIETFNCSKAENWKKEKDKNNYLLLDSMTCSSAFKNKLAGNFGAELFKYLKFYLEPCKDNKQHPQYTEKTALCD